MSLATKEDVLLVGGQSPIMRWQEAVAADTPTMAGRLLRDIYHAQVPIWGEIIFTGACDFTCQHCIYPPSFARFNRDLPVEAWLDILEGLNRDLGIGTFVYDGRSVTAAGVEMLIRLRERLPMAKLGLIDNGISLRRHLGELAAARLDWIDVSIDGAAEAHDRQRGRRGSYAAAIDGIQAICEYLTVPRLSVLTCLTALNRGSVVPMIRSLNGIGLKNFFITPVTVVEDVRPASTLAVDDASLLGLIDELENLLGGLRDAYVEVGLFDARHARAVVMHGARRLMAVNDHLEWTKVTGDSECAVRYYPASLTGSREIIVNTDGRVIVSRSMAHGQIPENMVVGDAMRERTGAIYRNMTETAGFQMYLNELMRERELLRGELVA